MKPKTKPKEELLSLSGRRMSSTGRWLTLAALSVMLAAPGSLVCKASTAPPTAITLVVHKKTVKEALSLLEKTYGYAFFYTTGTLETSRRITLNLRGQSIDTVMRQILNDTGCTYTVNGKKVYIERATAPQTPRPARHPAKTKTQSQTHRLTGLVTDANTGEPLIGVTVQAKDEAGHGTITDIDGKYSLDVTNNTELIFSYVGYKPQTLLVNDLGVLNVKLHTDNEVIDEVVVVGAGTQKKVSVTGSISSLKGSDLVAPTSNLTSNLAGKLSGLITSTTSGEPGSTSEFYIRGINTFGGRATPLILLDGVEISSADLNSLPPETIESFSILKDASATAIYGARGANGVMLVTTKVGAENTRARINVTYEHSFLHPVNVVEYADGVTYMKTYNEALLSRNPTATPKYTDLQIENTRKGLNPYVYPDVDWYDLMLKKWTQSQRANVNIQGGGSRVTYYMSLQANHDEGALKVPKTYSMDNNHSLWRYVFQNNIEYKVTSTTKLGLRMNAQIMHQTSPNTSAGEIFRQIYYNNPVSFPATYPDDGSGHLNFGSDAMSSSEYFTNPYANMLNTFKEENQSKINVSVNLDQKLDFLLKGLSYTMLINFNSWYYSGYTRSLKPYLYRIRSNSYNAAADNFTLEQLQQGDDFISQSDVSKSGDNTFYLDARLNYNQRFGKHNVSGMLMYMMREFRSSVLPQRNQGFSGRFTYDYDNRYLAEVNFGYNGTERLAKHHRFEFFPAMSLGWVASGEKFWEPLRRYVSHLKIRASYGLVGSDETGIYAGAPYYMYKYDVSLNGGPYFKTGMSSSTSIEANGPQIKAYPVDNGSWERSKQFDAGLDLQLFDQLNFTIDYFNYKRSRILLSRASFPRIMGYQGVKPWSNMGKVDNKGVEFSLSWHKQVGKDLTFDAKVNYTYAKNKLVYKDEPDYEYTWQVETGKPLNATYGYLADGLFKDDEDIANHADQSYFGSKVMPGDIKYRDVNGDGVIDSEDKVMISPYGKQPLVQYGLSLSVRYKKVDVNVFFNGSAKRKIMLDVFYNIQPFNLSAWSNDRNLMKWIADSHWTAGADNTSVAWPRMGVQHAEYENNIVPSTFWMRNGNFLRFKTLEIGYTLPLCRIYFSGDNLALWSSFKYWDPELDYNTYPLARTFNIGVQFHF